MDEDEKKETMGCLFVFTLMLMVMYACGVLVARCV